MSWACVEDRFAGAEDEETGRAAKTCGLTARGWVGVRAAGVELMVVAVIETP